MPVINKTSMIGLVNVTLTDDSTMSTYLTVGAAAYRQSHAIDSDARGWWQSTQLVVTDRR